MQLCPATLAGARHAHSMTRRSRTPLASVARPGAIVAGILALLAGSFLVVGLMLPSTVEVTRTVDVEAPPEAIFPLLDDLRKWLGWTPWGEVASRLEGPASGPGASRVWEDRRLGSGSLTLLRTRPPSLKSGPAGVDYLVELEGGAVSFEGTIALERRGTASRVLWTERASMGWNPLLGWTALGMEESQGRQLDESLARLKALVEGSG